jgi:hypothetical protein
MPRKLKTMKKKLFLITLIVIVFSSCTTKKTYTTCDCADLTYSLYQEYEKILFGNDKPLRKIAAMRKMKKEHKKTEIYKECRKQGVRPLSIIHYPKNKKIFASCDSWQSMEKKIDTLWDKIKQKIRGEKVDLEEDDE